MYLPNHVVIIYKRIWYYVHGEIANITRNGATEGLRPPVVGSVTSKLVIETADNVLRRLDEL